MFSSFNGSKRPLTAIVFSLIVLLYTNAAYAAPHQINIDGALGDWADEVGFYSDPYQDTTPKRTDITQYGLTVIDNGANPESLALVMVTEEYANTGNATGDSHKMVFYVGPYSIVVTIQNGCDNINSIVVSNTGGTITAPVTASAVGIINPPFYAPTDTTADCALELKFPISSLPLLDSNSNGKLLDENFTTNFATRQSGGVGNDNDKNNNNGLAPTAVSLRTLSGTSNGLPNAPLPIVAVGLLLIVSLFLTLRRRA